MRLSANFRTIFLIWLAWAVTILGYQTYVRWRFVLERPDHALSWTPGSTQADSQSAQPYLTEPFLNAQVSWDSEYYLSIAVAGYDDPAMRAIPADFRWDEPQIERKGDQPTWVSLNHAFFPLYPLLMRLTSWPLRRLGLNPVAAATLAGVLISLLGTLGAMLALYDLGCAVLGEASGLRAAFYLVIWPAGMFLAQVYTEGLFLGLSFGALALARREKWAWAALLAAGATWTRAAGALLLLPLAWSWWQCGGRARLVAERSWRVGVEALWVLSPLWAYLCWNTWFGRPFHIVESALFNRHLLGIGETLYDAVTVALPALTGANLPGRAYYLLEFGALIFGFVAVVGLRRRYPVLALYSLALIVFSFTSGAMQGMHRYVMGAPVVFLLPAAWGENPAFDRAWTLGSTLFMGVLAIVFSFDFFAG
ncbi:MAG: mannosyltransferase family protein [Chloroflexota bacterium]